MNNRFFDQQRRALEWAVKKELCKKGNVQAQTLKLCEEVGELVGAILKQRSTETRLEFGDVLVTLTILADQLGLEFGDCLRRAVDKIESRTGQTIEGVFIKNESY